MAKTNIDIPALFRRSVELYKEYGSFVFGVMTTYFILGMVPQVYLFLYQPAEPTTESQIISIIALLVQLFLALGFTKIMLYLVDDRPVQVSDLVNNGGIFLNYCVGYFVYFIAVGIGLALLVVPGIYIAIRLLFYPYYIIEHGDPSFIALQKSWKATEEWVLELFLFGICLVVLNFVGSLLLGIGIILTYPLTTMATAIIFMGLQQNAQRIPTGDYMPKKVA